MILREEDIACFSINWNDKATNIRQIANRLKLAPDHLVFVDDNPFERNLVRGALPMVASPSCLTIRPTMHVVFRRQDILKGCALTSDDLQR